MEKIANVYSLLLKNLTTSTLKHSAVSFSGTAITGVLGVIFYALVARNLGPDDYGVFSISITSIALLASISNVGLDTGLLKFVGAGAHTKSLKPLQITKLALEIKFVIWAILLIVGWISMPLIVQLAFNKPMFVVPFRIALIGAGATMLFSFSTTLYQAYSRFFAWSAANIGSNLVRLGIVAAFILSTGLSMEIALWSYISVLIGIFLIRIITNPQFLSVSGEWKYFSEFMTFNKWIAAFTIIAAIGSRIDTYLVARFMSLSEVGQYAVGVSLVSFVTQIVLALASVVATKFTKKSKSEFLIYFKKLQIFVALLAVVGISIGIPLGAVLIPFVYGPAFTAAIIPFSILLIAQAIFLFAVPVHTSVIYYFNYPKLFIYITAFRLVLSFMLGLWLIPQYHAVGAALSVLIGNIFDFILPSLWVYRKLRQ